MGRINVPNTKIMAITKETKIEFSIGWFLSTIGSVITIFIAFYFSIQKPDNDSIKEQMKEHFELREKYLEEKFKHIDESVQGFSSGLSNLNTQVGELSKRQNASIGGNVAAEINDGGFN